MKIIIDGNEIEVEPGLTILLSALTAGVYIPHLCYHPDLPSFQEISPADTCYRGEEAYKTKDQSRGYQGCELCLVDIKGQEDPVLSCVTAVEEGMEVVTTSPRLEDLRQKNLASILLEHPHACLTCAQKEGCSLTQCSTDVPEDERCCPQFDYCELRKVSEYVGLREDMGRYVPRQLYSEEDKPLFIRDYNLCVGCLRCVRVCDEVIGARALGYAIVDNKVVVGTKRPSLEESGCRYCGACVEVCPTGAIRDKELKPGDKREALVPCSAACPVGMDVPSYVRCIAEGKDQEAGEIIRDKVPFSSCLGHICHHPCETECRRQELNQSISIRDLKRFALEQAGLKAQAKKESPTGKSVAILGAGPAGLTAAHFLAKQGHKVKVFDAQPEPGGLLRWAIPEYRLPRDVVKRETDYIESIGVEIQTNTSLSHETLFEQMSQKRWDALFLSTGAQLSKKIEVEGADVRGVLWGLDFLREVKQGTAEKMEGKVAVIGGGNVAVDVAMTALRLGASGVELACLEKREEMPAFAWEIQEAVEEGIAIHPGWGPHKIETDGEKIKGIELVACTSVFDQQGYFCPEFDATQSKSLEADMVILAVGQKTDFSYLPPELGVKITDEGTVKVNPDTLETDVPGIFAGGEASIGPASAVEAMEEGKKAASTIDKFLGSEGWIDEVTDGETGGLWMGEVEGFASKERVSTPSLSLDERCRSFDLIQLGFGEQDARQEAGRCLRCDQRLRLSSVCLPPELWIEFNEEMVDQMPESEGAFQLLDEEKNIVYIAGAQNLRQTLQEQLSVKPEVKYFGYDEDPMYTKRESELIQQFLQKHGRLPPGNEDVDDLF